MSNAVFRCDLGSRGTLDCVCLFRDVVLVVWPRMENTCMSLNRFLREVGCTGGWIRESDGETRYDDRRSLKAAIIKEVEG